MIRVLLYAVNHVGLGHVVRLSIVQRALVRDPAIECFFFTDSSHVKGFFTCPGMAVLDDESASRAENSRRFYKGFFRAIETFRPHLILCDTYWPEAIIADLRVRGIRTALIMRMMHGDVIKRTLKNALQAFDTILVPHHPDEVLWTYRNVPPVIRLLESSTVGFIGPIARQAKQHPTQHELIFALGGGGEWPGASRVNRIETQLSVFYEVAGLLMRDGYRKPTLAVGPMLRVDEHMRQRFKLTRTRSLYRRFGPQTVIVSRGGYNTCWEAVAAGSLFISCGSHQGDENVKARAAFLQHAALGRKAPLSPKSLFDAIVESRATAEIQSVAAWSDVINAGLPVLIDELRGGSFLRAKESAPIRKTHDLRRIVQNGRRPHGRNLVARFDDVSPMRLTSTLAHAIRQANQMQYRSQLHVLRCDGSNVDPSLLMLAGEAVELWAQGDTVTAIAELASITRKRISGASFQSEEACVDVLAFPGRRLRNELRIARELKELRHDGLTTGLRFPAGRMPPILSQYLLRLFSLYTRM